MYSYTNYQSIKSAREMKALNMVEEIMLSDSDTTPPMWLPALQAIAKLVLTDIQPCPIDWLCYLGAGICKIPLEPMAQPCQNEGSWQPGACP